ncbi:SDR family oxidoreductase [Maritalea porphyrae]|jgi:enoyl-[acyl-carrier protein] reductase I|uniref:enoyl-ACP reductase FabI n=1 Tax=Maritalea porphyrae TaxID=880732 RepID=UPI0022AEE409|nr:SDR family oxidoreductase [Maritalea porphyrae]MCZ4271323.1 SDR family oxidoreductase [Maritalea porphyrae]
MTDGNLMQGKRGVIMGVANNRSIAWGIAKAAASQGAELAFTYQGEALKRRVDPLAAEVGSDLVVECDVTNPEALDKAFADIEAKWGKIDFLVHAIAFADKAALEGRYIDTTVEQFKHSMEISAYSLVAVAKRAHGLMKDGGSILTLSYYGAEKVIPNYNLMGVAKAALEASVRYLAADLGPEGIRVNGISAGAIKTLAASGIGDFRKMLAYGEANSPLRRNVSTDEVGNAGMYLLSDLSSGVTGEIHYVDSGYNVMGMSVLKKEDE